MAKNNLVTVTNTNPNSANYGKTRQFPRITAESEILKRDGWVEVKGTEAAPQPGGITGQYTASIEQIWAEMNEAQIDASGMTDEEFLALRDDPKVRIFRVDVPTHVPVKQMQEAVDKFAEGMTEKVKRTTEPAKQESLEDNTVAELEEMAKGLEIPGISKMKKAELIEAIQKAQKK